MAVPGRDAEDIWNFGTGIIERLGGRAYGACPSGVFAPDTEKPLEENSEREGESRCMIDELGGDLSS